MEPNGHSATTGYDKWPSIHLDDSSEVWSSDAVWARVHAELTGHRTMAIDTYPGTELDVLVSTLGAKLPGVRVIDVEDRAARPIEEIDALIAANLTHDRVFGVLSHHDIREFFIDDRLTAIAVEIATAEGPTLVVGWGASLVPVSFDTIVLADLARWEIQRRQRAGAPNWRCINGDEDVLRKVKRGFFVEWRIADRHKQTLFERIDFLLDANASTADPKMITGDSFRAGLAKAASQPFRVAPFFDPGVWGGQWMKETFNLDTAEQNYAWCFDCVPEENSLLFQVQDQRVEVPALDLVLMYPRELLGAVTHARFGAEFPIRFDLLDTMAGGNLSLQVHPLKSYIQNAFGMQYTQDESYYLLDAAVDAVVYLGTKTGTDPDTMIEALERATGGTAAFDTDAFINEFPAKKHDHFSIPAGTVHCSGADSMVLEISATPYLFTFKMWDWGRVGLDGMPRPIHLEHAAANIQWERDTAWVQENLIDQVTEIARGDGWVEERTGLHELEFIEVRRHWFTQAVSHDTGGTVNVLNLVEGAEAIVESPSGAFAPFVVHYAETFIIPAQVGQYSIRPHGVGAGQRLGTVKAYVRGTQVDR